MNQKNIAQLLKMLGAEKVADSPDWVMCGCPFAGLINPATGKTFHKSGKDGRPSFGVKVDKMSGYHCFSCGRKGRLSMLPSYLSMLSGKDLKSIRKFVMEHEHLGLEEYEPEDEKPEVSIMPEGLLDRFVNPFHHQYAHAFLMSRGLLKQTIKAYGLKFDKVKDRVIFPVRNQDGDLIGIRGRTILPECDVKYLTYKDMQMGGDAKYCGYWFGQQIQPKPGKLLILVEGELDAIMTRQTLGKGAVWAAMGASITKRQIETIKSMTTNPILILFDNDQAGHDAAERLVKEIRGFVPRIYMVKNYFGRKDPAEMAQAGVLKKALRTMEES